MDEATLLRGGRGVVLLDPGPVMQLSSTDNRYVSLQAGDQPVPGFRLIRRRGRGGFGEVWEASASGGFLVALKFVRLSNRGRDTELRALDFVRSIHHPNLLANFGSWLVDDTLIIGMELADRSLWDRYVEATQQGYLGIPRGELLGYLSEVAAGIDHLNDYRHTFEGRSSVGVQHRDLKPPNILLFGGGAKVADLGMARAMEGEVAGHTGIWTFPYAAPEFFRGATTRQSDQYGLAATFCQLRSGRLPFSGSAASVTAGHLFARPNLDALPGPERSIVERALAKVPGDRWPSCRAFVDALRSLPDDAVADVLIDSESQSGVPGDLRTADGFESSDPGGFDPLRSGLLDSIWLRDTAESGSMWGPSGATTLPPTGGDVPCSTHSTPTLILPAATPQSSESPPSSTQRSGRYRRSVAAMAVVALLLVVVGTVANSRSHQISPDVTAEPPVLPLTPVVSGGDQIASVEASEPERTPQIAQDLPSEPLPVAVAPEPALLPASPSEPVAAAPDLVLEGPIEMDLSSPLDLTARADDQQPGRTEQSHPPAVTVAPAPPAQPRQLDATVTPTSASLAVPDVHVGPPDAPATLVVAGTDRDQARAAIVLRPALAASPPPAPTAEAAFARGRDLFLRNSYARAADEFSESIRLNPGHAPSYLLRAIARHRAGDPRAALDDYAAAIRARPDDVTAYISRGQAYHELGAYDRAIADYDAAIRRRPGDGDTYFRRGLAQFKAGNDAAAIPDFAATLRLDPTHAYAAEFQAEAIARRDARTLRAPTPRTDPSRSTLAAAPTLERPGPTAAGSAPLRATSYLAPPTPTGTVGASNAAPTSRAKTDPNATDRRRATGRRLLPWPFPRGK